MCLHLCHLSDVCNAPLHRSRSHWDLVIPVSAEVGIVFKKSAWAVTTRTRLNKVLKVMMWQWFMPKPHLTLVGTSVHIPHRRQWTTQNISWIQMITTWNPSQSVYICGQRGLVVSLMRNSPLGRVDSLIHLRTPALELCLNIPSLGQGNTVMWSPVILHTAPRTLHQLFRPMLPSGHHDPWKVCNGNGKLVLALCQCTAICKHDTKLSLTNEEVISNKLVSIKLINGVWVPLDDPSH